MKTSVHTLIVKTLFLMGILLITATGAFAAGKEAPSGNAVSDQSTSLVTPQPLGLRKQKAVADLQQATDALGTIAQKVSNSITYLSQAGIATDVPQTALLKAETKILSASVSLTTLSKAYVTGDTLPKEYTGAILDEAAVKASVIAIQDELLLARQSLIESLSSLKTSITAR